jgi:hypothetical protein
VARAWDLCSAIGGVYTGGSIPVKMEDLKSVIWFNIHDDKKGLKFAQDRAHRRPFPTDRPLLGTGVFSTSERLVNPYHFNEPVPAEAYYRQGLDCRFWDGMFGDCQTITYGRYRPHIILPDVITSLDPAWASCTPIRAWGIKDPPIALTPMQAAQVPETTFPVQGTAVNRPPPAATGGRPSPPGPLPTAGLGTSSFEIFGDFGQDFLPDRPRLAEDATPGFHLLSTSTPEKFPERFVITLSDVQLTITSRPDTGERQLIAGSTTTTFHGSQAVAQGHTIVVTKGTAVIDGTTSIPIPTQDIVPTGGSDTTQARHPRPHKNVASSDNAIQSDRVCYLMFIWSILEIIHWLFVT